MRNYLHHLHAVAPRSWITLFLLWACLSVVGIAVSVSRQIQHLERQFETESQALYDITRQRLDQNEAVLSGIEALFKTFPNLGFDGIRGYAHAMLERYPHIYTVGLQPRVLLSDVSAFETRAGKSIRPGYRIRDYELDGDRTWRPAAPRPFYYPVTFMEPPIEAASPVLGLDVYADPKLHKAIDDSASTGQSVASAPFSLVEGGRGYIFFKALRSKLDGPADNLVSLLINASKLIRPDELPKVEMSVSIHHQDYALGDPSGQLFAAASHDKSGPAFAKLFPVFKWSQKFTTNRQPFVLETSYSPSWAVLDPISIAGALTLSTMTSMLLMIIYVMRQQRLFAEKAADQRLQHERMLAQVTLAAISDAVIRVDANAMVEYVNVGALHSLGVDGTEVVGRHIVPVVRLELALSREAEFHPVLACLHEGQHRELPENATLIQSNGISTLIEGSVSPLFDDKGAVSGAVLTFRDMGPVRKRALEALEASEQRLRQHQSELAHVARLNTMGEMASGIAHELNQPLNAILNYNQACIRLLRDEEPDFDEISHAMSQAAMQSKRAGEIIKRLRAFVSKHGTEPVPLSLEQVSRNALILAENEIHDHQVHVTIRFPEGLPFVIADSIQMEQVMLNLLRNSIDAMAETPKDQRQVTITASCSAQNVTVAVHDQGHGIPDDMLETIFHPFLTSKAHGMGLGLTICHSIVESYGGRFWAENHPDGGAILSFALPIATHHENEDSNARTDRIPG